MKETKFMITIIIIKLKVNKVESKHCELKNCLVIHFKRISSAPLRKAFYFNERNFKQYKPLT